MKVIIAGGRDFSDYKAMVKTCSIILSNKKDVEIVSGECKGADKLGEMYAIDNGLKISRFPADWDAHGKSAGYKRNVQMANYADGLIAFWDGKSKGTKHMINIANATGLKVRIHYY